MFACFPFVPFLVQLTPRELQTFKHDYESVYPLTKINSVLLVKYKVHNINVLKHIVDKIRLLLCHSHIECRFSLD